MRAKIRRLTSAAVLFSVVLIAALPLSCGKATDSLPRSETLYVAGNQWGTPSTLNPLAPEPDWPVGDPQRELLYETLFAFNMITGDLEPLLATGYLWTDDVTLEVKLQEAARWQNGEPVTADDVVCTFDLAKRYTVTYSAFWDYMAAVEAVDAHTVRMKLNPETRNRLMALNYLCQVNILPKTVFEAKEREFDNNEKALKEWTNLEPVGSGPYRLRSFSAQKIVLERDDGYWGRAIWGVPVPKYVAHFIYKGNESGNLALEKGDVDVSQQFIPQIWKMWEGGKPIGAWFRESPYFYVEGSMPSLIFNMHRKPMSDPAFRRAVAHALNYEKIAELAMTRYSPTMVPGLISKFGREGKYFDQKIVDEYGWSYDPAKAEAILQAAGYRKADGQYAFPDGTPMPTLKLECPHGWTDWVSTLTIAAQNLREIGLDAKAEFPEEPVFTDRIRQGDFGMMMFNPSGAYSPAQPWLKFRGVFDSRGVPDIGKGLAFWNWGRYRNEEAQDLLDRVATAADEAERKQLYGELNVIFMRDIPVLPLEYRPWIFYSFNTTHWENFPTSDNDYAPPQLLTEGAGIRAIYKIRPAGR